MPSTNLSKVPPGDRCKPSDEGSADSLGDGGGAGEASNSPDGGGNGKLSDRPDRAGVGKASNSPDGADVGELSESFDGAGVGEPSGSVDGIRSECDDDDSLVVSLSRERESTLDFVANRHPSLLWH